MRLLLVEDDPLLGDGICVGLTQEGYRVNWVQDGDAAANILKLEQYDLVVLDLGIPKLAGLDVLKQLRKRGNALPVLILTARDTVQDRVKGLDAGADDYLIKPFNLDELCARLRALTRRQNGSPTPTISIGMVSLDPVTYTVTMNGLLVAVSPKEFAILQILMGNMGKVLSRVRLEQSLYAWDEEAESNTVEVHICHLRKKLGMHFIRTMRGVGYIIDKTP